MQRYLLTRAAQAVLLLLGVLIIVFFLVRLTGDPASLMVARDAPEEVREAFREAMGFNRPLIVQFFDYLGGAPYGEISGIHSILSGRPWSLFYNDCRPPFN